MTLIKKLIRMCHGITDPTTTPLKTSIGQILNFGGHHGSECHRVPLPIRLNRKPFREQIGKCCTAFATTRHSRCDAVISFIWINSSRRSESQAAMTQCNQKMKVKAVMTIFGRSLTSGDLCVHFFNIFWNHFHSWNTLSTSLCSSFPFWTYCISQGMVRVCPFAIFLIGPWLEFDPSASEQFWLNEQFGPNAERFTDAWALTYFCMATCSLLAIHRLMQANFQKYFCWVADFMFQQVVMQVCRELQRSSVVRALHDWFCTFGNCHIVRTLQTGSVFSPWSQTSKELGINGVSCQPTDSGSIAIVGLYRTNCEWGTTHCVVLLRSWFDFHSTCCQFVRHDSGRFLAQLRLRCGSSLPMWGHFAGTASPFSFTIDSIVDKVIYMGCVCRHCYTSIQLVGQRSSLQSWACLCLMSFQLADGANPGPDYLGSTDECLGPGGDSSANNGTSMSWLVPVLCSAISLFATWVVRKWWKFLPPATTMEEVDYATLGSAFDRINSENNCLRREVSSLNGALSELFSVVGRLREDLDGITADHDRLAEQVGWQHVGMVRLGGFNPYQSLSIQQRQQVFARERRNMMAYRAMGPDGFMSTVLHQDRLLGLQSDFNVVGGVGARLDYPREEATADTRLLIEFNDVGDGSSLPRDVLWAIARNKLQIELYNCLVREDFTRARLFQQALLFFIDVSHQDRLLNRQDQVRLFAYLGDHLESLSDGLRGEDEARANDYLALASRFRRVASSH